MRWGALCKYPTSSNMMDSACPSCLGDSSSCLGLQVKMRLSFLRLPEQRQPELIAAAISTSIAYIANGTHSKFDMSCVGSLAVCLSILPICLYDKLRSSLALGHPGVREHPRCEPVCCTCGKLMCLHFGSRRWIELVDCESLHIWWSFDFGGLNLLNDNCFTDGLVELVSFVGLVCWWLLTG